MNILNWIPRPILKMIVWVYDRPRYHIFVSIPLAFWDTVFGLFYRLLFVLHPLRIWKDWQGRPEPSFPLPMTHHDVPVQPQKSDAVGMYLTTMVVTYTDAEQLRRLLPEDVELDPAHIHNGQHAMIYMFGCTQNLHRAWCRLPGMTYLEFVACIPHVRILRKGGFEAPFCYLPQLRLNRFYPTVLGWLVGYPKIWSRVDAGSSDYQVRTLLGGKPILRADFTPFGEQRNPAKDENLSHWRDLLSEPHANAFGSADLLFLHYHWAWDNGLMQAVSAKLDVQAELPGLKAGHYEWQPINFGAWNGDMAPEGAFRLTSPFDLLSPFSRKKLARWKDAQLMSATAKEAAAS
jgi:hypothetical protein